MKRKITAGVAAIMMVGSLAACASAEEPDAGGDDSITIGLAVANLQADFFNQIRQ